MGSPSAVPVVVRELWHATGQLQGDNVEGLVSVLPLGGSDVFHDSGYEVHLPRATEVAFAGHLRAARVPAATALSGGGKWRRGCGPCCS